jgi:glycosyltransferase involved in cell wall biosynthesis
MIMPNYNDAHMIEGAISGALSQTRKPDEIIIIDDGSSDNSLEILNSIVEKHSHLTLLVNEKNQGVVYSFNRALEQTKTEYVCFASMDDGMEPTWIEKSMQMLSYFPDAGICCSDLYQDYPDGTRGEIRGDWCKEPTHFSGRDFAHIVNGHYIAGTTVVVKKEPFMKVGAYRPELRWHSDWFAWLVVAMRHGVCVIPECLVTLQVRDTSHSEIGRKKWEEQSLVIRNIYRLLNSAEFRDVLPHFAWGNIMSHFGADAVKAIVEIPELWNQSNLMLCEKELEKISNVKLTI